MSCLQYQLSSPFPSERGRPPGAADQEASGGLGAFSSGCNHDSSRPWRLLSVPLRCSHVRDPRHSEPHMVANRWSFLKAGLDIRGRGLCGTSAQSDHVSTRWARGGWPLGGWPAACGLLCTWTGPIIPSRPSPRTDAGT